MAHNRCITPTVVVRFTSLSIRRCLFNACHTNQSQRIRDCCQTLESLFGAKTGIVYSRVTNNEQERVVRTGSTLTHVGSTITQRRRDLYIRPYSTIGSSHGVSTKPQNSELNDESNIENNKREKPQTNNDEESKNSEGKTSRRKEKKTGEGVEEQKDSRNGENQKVNGSEKEKRTETGTEKKTKDEPRRAVYQRPKGMSHYDVIGVKPTVALRELKKAYKQRARQLHPDLNPEDPNAADKFVDLQVAYQILTSPVKRGEYDQTVMKTEKEQQQKKRYTVNADAEYWKAQWKEETAEQKALRRERYEAFATGKFKAPEGMVIKNLGWTSGTEFYAVMFTFCLTFWVYYKLGITTRDPEVELDDSITSNDWRGSKYVDAYLNPFTLEWEKLAEGQEPPTPDELRLFYWKVYGPLAVNRDVYPTKALTRVKMPKIQTTIPVMYRDKQTGVLFELTRKKKRSTGVYQIFEPPIMSVEHAAMAPTF